jgi:hypothetical protein
LSFPSPWSAPSFYSTVKIGGRPIKATLVAIGGNKIEDEWNVQRPTGASGATNVFKGTKPAGPATLTFEAVAEDEFDDLREVYELLAPKVGSTTQIGGASTVGSPGSAAYGQQYAQGKSTASAATPTASDLLVQAQQALAQLQSGAAAPAVQASASSPVLLNPGPRPPTLSIENGYLNYVGINAISRASWEGPTPTETSSFRVVIGVVLQREPRKAAVGPASAQSPDNPGQRSIPLGEIQDPANAAKTANAAFAQAGAQ